jgi:hypothetical protein
MKTLLLIFLLLVVAASPAWAERQLIPMAPPIVKMNVQKPLPFPGVFYVSEETKNFRYQSPDKIPWGIRPNAVDIRPFEIPVGQAFTEAAYQAFSQVLAKLNRVETPQAPNRDTLLIEPRLEKVKLGMKYMSYDNFPKSQMLDVGGQLEAKLRLVREGKPDWEKTYQVAIPNKRIQVEPLTGKQISRMVAEALGTLVRKMTSELLGETDQPATPLNQWLKP